METEKILSKICMPRNIYINEAINHYNKFQKRQLLEQRLQFESKLVQKDSMKVLKDFENFEDEN